MSFSRKLVSVLWVEFLALVGAAFFYFVLQFEPAHSFICSLLVCMLLLLFTRFFSLFYINKGTKFLYKNEHRLALKEFEKSYTFFSKHDYLDKYRHIFLFLMTKFSILEISLSQMIVCHIQLGEVEMAKEVYKVLYEKFPKSYLTDVSSKNLDLIESKQSN